MNERHPAPINIEGLRQRIRVMAFDRGTLGKSRSGVLIYLIAVQISSSRG
jgi:hypothetical protein